MEAEQQQSEQSADDDTGPTRRDLEKALRDAGLSHRQARKFVSAGWPAIVGDEQAELDEMRDLLGRLSRQWKRS